MDASIVIRTYNEAKWLPDLLAAVKSQKLRGMSVETLIVDSGSTDGTLRIAEEHHCRVVHIRKEDFTFGRSLNVGCAAAEGTALVFISGHCIPVGKNWLANLICPLLDGRAEYVYGHQQGHESSKYSEHQLFRKYYPERSAIPQNDIFCNNANSALLRAAWADHPFDENLTGLEDMELAKRLVATGKRIGYVADSSVIHIHEETWARVKNRYEREAIALQSVLPDVHVNFWDFLRYFLAGVLLDSGQAIQDRAFTKHFGEIFMFRLMQYWGTYRGNHQHRRLSAQRKEAYFYPR